MGLHIALMRPRVVVPGVEPRLALSHHLSKQQGRLVKETLEGLDRIPLMALVAGAVIRLKAETGTSVRLETQVLVDMVATE